MIEDKDNPMLNHSTNSNNDNNQHQLYVENWLSSIKNFFNLKKIKPYFKFSAIGGKSRFKDENDGMKSGPEIGIKIDF